MARLTSRHPHRQVAPANLLDHVTERYLSQPPVREWLLNRDPHQLRHVDVLHTAFSYACMYYPPTYIPTTYGRYPLPKPFLDLGDLLLYHKLHDHIALGSIFNPNETHALSIVRDEMLRKSQLSRTPRARNFAVDLRVPYLEIVEFAWMEDNSLILACRRLHTSPDAPHKPLVLSADVAFYPVLAPHESPFNVLPLLRMSIRELVAVCQFCGLRGIHTCACPPSFKTRAPSSDASYTPVPFNPAAFGANTTTSTVSSHPNLSASVPASQPDIAASVATTAAFHNGHVNNNNNNINKTNNINPAADPTLPPADLNGADPSQSPGTLMTWQNYAHRIFKCNQVGAFFIQWHRLNRAATALEPFIKPRHPIPYQFVCGSKRDTLRLASLYIVKLRLCNKGLAMADLRLRDESSANVDSPPSPSESTSPSSSLNGTAAAHHQSEKQQGKMNQNCDQLKYQRKQQLELQRQYRLGLLRGDLGIGYAMGYASGQCDARYARGEWLGDESMATDPAGYGVADSLSQAATTTGTRTAARTMPTTATATRGAPAMAPTTCRTGPGSPRAVAETSVAPVSGCGDGSASSDKAAAAAPAAAAATGTGTDLATATGTTTVALSGGTMATRPLEYPSRDVESYMTLNEERTPTCRKCRRSFPKRGNLTRHVKIVHLGLKPFQCQVCGRRFGYKTHLKRHESGHVRRHDCACYVCSQPFRGWPALQRHMRSAHADLEAMGDDDEALLLRDEVGS